MLAYGQEATKHRARVPHTGTLLDLVLLVEPVTAAVQAARGVTKAEIIAAAPIIYIVSANRRYQAKIGDS
jgi:hypothetical protein